MSDLFGTAAEVAKARKARNDAESAFRRAIATADDGDVSAAYKDRQKSMLVVMGVAGKLATVDEARAARAAAGDGWSAADLWPGLVAAREAARVAREGDGSINAANNRLEAARVEYVDAMLGQMAAERAAVYDWRPTGRQFVEYVKAIMTSETMDDEEERIAALLGVPRGEVQYAADQLYVSGRHFSAVTPAMTVEEAREAVAAAGPHWPGANMWVSAASVADAYRAYVAAVDETGLPPQHSPREAARGDGTALAGLGERVLVAVMWDAAAGGGEVTTAVRTLARWAAACVHRIRAVVGDAVLHRPGGPVPVVEWVTGSMARALWDAQADPNAARAAAGLLSTIAALEAEYGITDAVAHYATVA